ncbi:MAG: SIS domain-containing protein [Sarcina sp.]
MISSKYYNLITEKLEQVMSYEKENILKAAKFVAQAIENGGILQSFGSGHSYAAAIEVAGRAGGYIPSKIIERPDFGELEIVEGVGTVMMKKSKIDVHDIFFIISNSGRNPLPIEIAKAARENGAKVVVVTSLDVSKNSKSNHSEGKNLFEYADVILDNHSVEGDCAISMEGLDVNVGPTSTIVASLLLNSVILESYDILIKKGIKPPIFMSANVDGGREFNQKLLKKYEHRVYRR